MPQLAVSTRSVERSSSLILPRSLLADLSVSVPMMLRSVVRARLTIWYSYWATLYCDALTLSSNALTLR